MPRKPQVTISIQSVNISISGKSRDALPILQAAFAPLAAMLQPDPEPEIDLRQPPQRLPRKIEAKQGEVRAH